MNGPRYITANLGI